MLPDIFKALNRWQDNAGSVRRLRVRWFLNPGNLSIANAEITDENGIITDIRRLPESASEDVLPVVLVPQLVNVHTHLEFSHLVSPLQPAQPFQEWIRSLMRTRTDSAVDRSESVRCGLQESQSNGVSLIGNISTDAFPDRVSNCPDDVVSFRESIGLTPERIRDELLAADRHLCAESQPGVINGLSPHAPYTVHPELLHGLVDLAEEHGAPVAMHVAETTDEVELLIHGRGRFAAFLDDLGLFDRAIFPGGRCVLEILRELSRARRALVVHGNYLTNTDVEFLRDHPNLTTVYCPRTHHFFGHCEHPLRRLRAAGCRVVLGTDSRASNPDLNIWCELQFVAGHFPEISPGDLLAMITTDAADSLGVDPDAFRLRIGGALAGVLLACDEPITTVDDFIRSRTVRIAARVP